MNGHVVGQYRFRALVMIAAREMRGRKKESNARMLALNQATAVLALLTLQDTPLQRM